jgi:hypothetical protein
MRPDDRVEPAGLDEQCLIHHFIRAYGRRPSTEELSAFRSAGATRAPTPSRQHMAMSGALAGTVRREFAKLVTRL